MLMCCPECNVGRQLIDHPLSAIIVKHTVFRKAQQRGFRDIEVDNAKDEPADLFGCWLTIACG